MLPTLALLSISVPAVYGDWHSSQLGGGGYIQNVVTTSDRTRLYAYVDVGGLYRSEDAGRRWTMLHGALPAFAGNYEVRGLVVHPDRPDEIVIATGSQWEGPSGAWKSQDGGRTFRRTLEAPFMGNGDFRWAGTILARDPRASDVILAGTVGAGVFRSEDSGETWQPVGATGGFAADLEFDAHHPDWVYLCCPEWTGNGQTMGEQLWRSSDAGRTWTKVADRSPIELLSHPTRPGVLVGLLDDRPALSFDRGVTWQPFEEGLPPLPLGDDMSRSRFRALAAGPDFLLVGGSDGTVWRRDVDDSAWRPVPRATPTELYEGREWFRKRHNSAGWALGSLVVDPRDPGHWFFTDWFAIYQTWDAGTNWTLTIDGIECTVIHRLASDPSRAGRVLMGMADNGGFVSSDGARRFQPVEGLSINIKSLSFCRDRPSRAWACGTSRWDWFSNQPFVSDDGGQTWRRTSLAGLPDMEVKRGNTIVGDPREPDVAYYTVAGDPADREAGVYRTSDGGQTWSRMSDGLPAGATFFRESIWACGAELAASADGSLIAISVESGQVARWTGERWDRVDVPLAGVPGEVVADPQVPGRFFIGLFDRRGVLRSDDGGRSWQVVSREFGWPLATDPAQGGRLVAQSSEGVAFSRDAGRTWRRLDRSLPHKSLTTLAITGNRVVAGTSGSGLFWSRLPRL